MNPFPLFWIFISVQGPPSLWLTFLEHSTPSNEIMKTPLFSLWTNYSINIHIKLIPYFANPVYNFKGNIPRNNLSKVNLIFTHLLFNLRIITLIQCDGIVSAVWWRSVKIFVFLSLPSSWGSPLSEQPPYDTFLKFGSKRFRYSRGMVEHTYIRWHVDMKITKQQAEINFLSPPPPHLSPSDYAPFLFSSDGNRSAVPKISPVQIFKFSSVSVAIFTLPLYGERAGTWRYRQNMRHPSIRNKNGKYWFLTPSP